MDAPCQAGTPTVTSRSWVLLLNRHTVCTCVVISCQVKPGHLCLDQTTTWSCLLLLARFSVGLICQEPSPVLHTHLPVLPAPLLTSVTSSPQVCGLFCPYHSVALPAAAENGETEQACTGGVPVRRYLGAGADSFRPWPFPWNVCIGSVGHFECE